ncbi:molybdenum cofactor guanylyltransferase [Ferviditalea candida]|uniref:Molybdenum cofactor guanylyltransferase n=1 Tax=Ferviditalea candida TaxID=3108399 RepID=A0ABU5ZPP9_9BACL|nr:molybdenum cofactor guanylyltransferase [Paenibacillaceae bacterium T2]
MLSGVILAGGDNKRMNGQVKALLTFEGTPLILRQIAEMNKICSEIIIVTNEPRLFLPLVDRSVRIITDFYQGKGILGGMHAGLMLSKHQNVWVIGSDMPFVSSKAAGLLLDLKENLVLEAAIPLIKGRLHPLHAIYDKSVAETVAKTLQSGISDVQDVLKSLRWAELTEPKVNEQGIPSSFVTAIKTQTDYKNALQSEQSGSEIRR